MFSCLIRILQGILVINGYRKVQFVKYTHHLYLFISLRITIHIILFKFYFCLDDLKQDTIKK